MYGAETGERCALVSRTYICRPADEVERVLTLYKYSVSGAIYPFTALRLFIRNIAVYCFIEHPLGLHPGRPA